VKLCTRCLWGLNPSAHLPSGAESTANRCCLAEAEFRPGTVDCRLSNHRIVIAQDSLIGVLEHGSRMDVGEVIGWGD